MDRCYFWINLGYKCVNELKVVRYGCILGFIFNLEKEGEGFCFW